MNNLLLSKRAVSPAIVLLVIAALSLSILALFYFNTIDKSLQETISMHIPVLKANEKRFILHFYTHDIFERSLEKFDEGASSEKFLEEFKKTASFYRHANGSYFVNELAQLENVGIDAIGKEGDEFILKVYFNVNENNFLIDVNYVYEDIFKKKIQ